MLNPPGSGETAKNKPVTRNTGLPATSSLQNRYQFPCKTNVGLHGSGTARSEIRYAKAYELFRDYLRKGNLKSLYTSLSCVSDAIILNPEKEKYWVTLGRVHSEMAARKVFQANTYAIQAYRQALELNPDDATTMILLGIRLTVASEYEDALQNFETALRKAPYLSAYNVIQWMNVAYLAGSRTKRGTLFYEQMTRDHPGLEYLYLFKAILHRAHFDFLQARKDLLRVAQSKATDKNIRDIARNLLEKMKDGEAQHG